MDVYGANFTTLRTYPDVNCAPSHDFCTRLAAVNLRYPQCTTPLAEQPASKNNNRLPNGGDSYMDGDNTDDLENTLAFKFPQIERASSLYNVIIAASGIISASVEL